MPGTRWIYQGPHFPHPGIRPETYISDYFYKEIELESEVFQDIRTANNIEPVCLRDSTWEEMREIQDFFEKWAESFFFLFDDGYSLIGSILLKRNYIQCLCVAPEYQRMSYGSKLVQYAVNFALDKGFASVELDILPGNLAAESLYGKLGFIETQ